MQAAAAETPPPILARAEVAGAVGVAAVAGEVGAAEVAEAVMVEKAGRKMVVLQRQTVPRTPIAAAMVEAAVHETVTAVVTK